MSDVHVTACYLKDTKELKLTFCWVKQITAVTLLFAASPLNFHLKQQEKKYPLAPRVHSYLIPLMTIVVVVKGTAEQRERGFWSQNPGWGWSREFLCSPFLSVRCDLWEGISEFVVHQGKDGRITRSDVTFPPSFPSAFARDKLPFHIPLRE